MSQFKNLISRFHQDQRGSNSLEQIVIFALGVLVLGGAWYMWKEMPGGAASGGKKGISGMIEFALGKLFSFNFSV